MLPAISFNAATPNEVLPPIRIGSAAQGALAIQAGTSIKAGASNQADKGQDKTQSSRRFAVADELSISSNSDSQAEQAYGKTTEAGVDKDQPAEGELTEEQEEQVEELKDRDREVRTHEQAHLAAAGPYALGGPTYEFEKGPDGQNYAVGGEVQIDTAPVDGDPEATIQKARIVRSAALAPAEPSSQDRAVAAQATQTEQQAQAELQAQRREETSGEAEAANEEGAQPGAATSPSTNQSNRVTSKLLQLIAKNAATSNAVHLNLFA